MPPQLLLSFLLKYRYKNIAILLTIKGIAIVMSGSFVIFEVLNQNNTLTLTDNFIPENDPIRVLDAIVEHLDISAIEATYKGGGASSFAPRMPLMCALKWR